MRSKHKNKVGNRESNGPFQICASIGEVSLANRHNEQNKGSKLKGIRSLYVLQRENTRIYLPKQAEGGHSGLLAQSCGDVSVSVTYSAFLPYCSGKYNESLEWSTGSPQLAWGVDCFTKQEVRNEQLLNENNSVVDFSGFITRVSWAKISPDFPQCYFQGVFKLIKQNIQDST